MTEKQLKELEWRYPFEEQWQYCYFDDNGNLYTPRIVDGVIIKTGEEVYEESKIPQQPQPSEIEILQQKVNDLNDLLLMAYTMINN